jgi:hypothetical protein
VRIGLSSARIVTPTLKIKRVKEKEEKGKEKLGRTKGT